MDIFILNIETATQICSVALSKGNEVLAVRQSDEKNAHSKNINIFIEKVFSASGVKAADLSAIAVSKGPGSYTGLRIGVSSAKALCYALDKPLISVGTLQSMALGMAITKQEEALYCPMIDARRMEVYTAVYDAVNNMIKEVEAKIIDEHSFDDLLKEHKTWFFGDGAAKCQELLKNHPNACFDKDFKPSASYMANIALQKFHKKEFEDVAYFEPFYLKDFIAGKPRVKGLR